jgi:uroporphyrinogen decarboxylase
LNPREIIREIVSFKRCPERMGLHDGFWDETMALWVGRDGFAAGTDPAEYFNMDIRYIAGSWFKTWAFPDETIVGGDDYSEIRMNGWGAKRRFLKNNPGVPECISFDLSNKDVWKKKYRETLLSLDTQRFGDIGKLRTNFEKAKAGPRFAVYVNSGVFEQMRESMGDKVMLESMCMAPDWIRDFCDVMTNFMIRHFEYAFREIGIPDGVWISEDMGYAHAPFISPLLYREMIMPFHKRLVDFIHGYGIPLIMHSCGKIQPLLAGIFDAGVDGLQAIEAGTGQDVAEFAQAVGNKMAFLGNINAKALETNDKKIIDLEIIPKLKRIRENRIPYVFGSDQSVSYSVKLEAYKYALELYRAYCRY